MRSRFLFFITWIFLVSCDNAQILGPGTAELLATAAQSDCGFVQNSFGQRVSWKSNIPITLKVDSNFSPDHVEILRRAALHWNEAAGKTLIRIIESDGRVPSKPAKDALNAVNWLREWPENQSNTQGVTNLYWRHNQITEADVSVNNKNFNFFTSSPQTPYDVHLESLLVHELGHVLGLKHRSTVPSVMWAALSSSVKRDSLSNADRETIKCEY
jgi:hypothetical protein